jgi:Thymidylate kinase
MTIIVIEGLDGAGKTTLATKLAEVLGYNYRHYPVDLEAAQKLHPGKNLDFYLIIDMLNNPPDPKQNWVVDRYYQSHGAYGGRYCQTLTIALELTCMLPKPDFSFLLDVDPLESFNRCAAIGKDTDITVKQREAIAERYRLDYEWTSVIPGYMNPLGALKRVYQCLGPHFDLPLWHLTEESVLKPPPPKPRFIYGGRYA